MSGKRKLVYVAFGAILVLVVQTLSNTGIASAQPAAASPTIKYVLTVDYPLGGKEAYLGWVKSVAADLSSPPEVQRITSYDNYYGASPHRFIELEFADMAAATRYFDSDSMRRIMGEWQDYGVNTDVHVLVQRSDYTR